MLSINHVLRRFAFFLLLVTVFTSEIQAQFTIRESFGENSLVSSRLVLGGAAQLTAASGVDPLGSGWLRLTGATTNQTGYCFVNEGFPANLGVFIEFEYTAWSTTNAVPEADGFSVFLFDSSYVPGTFQLGQDGGALGYGEVDAATHPTGWSLGPGLTGGYVGLGLDEFGNYSVKQTTTDNLAPGLRANAIAVRGPVGSHTTYLAGTGANLGGTVYAGQRISYGTSTATRPLSNVFYRKVRILIEKVGANYQLTVSMQVAENGPMNAVFGPIVLTDPPPAYLKLGFAASTGLYYATHEIKNLYITTPGAVHTEKNGQLVVSNNQNATYDVSVFNDSQNPLAGIPVVDTLPPAFQASGVTFSNDGYASNTYDGNGQINGRIFSGGKVNLQAYSRGTFRFSGKVVFQDSLPTILKNIAFAKAPSGFDDPDPSNDTSVFYSYRKPAISINTNTITCSGTPAVINLQTLINANIKWTVTTTGNITGATDGNATASNTGLLGISPTLVNTGNTPGTVTYTFTPSYTYTNPKDRAPVYVEGDPVSITITVNPLPTINALNNITVCAGDTVLPIRLVNGTTATFTWTNNNTAIGLAASGTGNSINGFRATNTTASPITGKIVVTATANSCEAKDSFNITVNQRPNVNFTINNPSQCLKGNSFVFTNATTTGNFVWDFGDGTTSTQTSPTHSYTDIGTYSVKLSTTGTSGCKDSLIRTVNVTVSPIVDFVYNVISTNNNSRFQFTDETDPGTIDANTTYFWDFGDGASSTEKNPIHEYTANGTYTVTLTVTNNNGCSASFSEQIIVNTNPNVKGGFTINNAEQCLTNNTFVFTNTTTTQPGITVTGYEWDFGDNSAKVTTISPTHTYSASGTYIVSLTVTINTGFKQTVTQSVIVKPIPTVNTVAAQTLCAGSSTNSINFSGSIAGTTYRWTNSNTAIGLAASGTGNIPSFVAQNTTTNNAVATLTVIPMFEGCEGVAQTTIITIKPSPTINALTAQTLCAGANTQAINFVTPVTGTTVTWENDNTMIGLAVNGTGNIPSFTALNPTPNPITAIIVATPTAQGCAGKTQQTTITVNPIPTLNNSLIPTPICDGALFSYQPSSATTGTTFSWQRAAVSGISNPAASGTGNPNEVLHNTTNQPVTVKYVFTLSANGCNNLQEVNLIVKPTPAMTSTLTPAPVCSGELFYYVPAASPNGTTFTWVRSAVAGITNPTATGSGAISENLINSTNAPVNVTYQYTLNSNNCQSTTNVVVTVKPSPALSSSLNPPGICSGTAFTYTPQSNVPGVIFSWSRPVVPGITNPAGSGSNSINEVLNVGDNLSHDVKYIYTLTANGCSNQNNVVTTTVSPLPKPAFNISSAEQCIGNNNFVFTNTTPGADITWEWNFGDGVTATTKNASYVYATTGRYTVTLKATTAQGCTAVTTQTVTVNAAPTASFIYQIIAPNSNDEFQFTNTSTSANGGLTYHWDFGDGATSTLPNPTHQYTDSGTFVVTLTVTDSKGCTATMQTNIKVTRHPNIVAGFTVNNKVQCFVGNEFIFTNTTVVEGGATIASYMWDFGDGNTSKEKSPTHSYIAPGNYSVTLTVVGSNGYVDEVSTSIEVVPQPVVNPIPNVSLCNGTTTDYIHFEVVPAETPFTWTNDHPEIGLAASGNDHIAPFVAVNTGTTPIVATITITPGLPGCTGTPKTFTITVYPTPIITSVAPVVVCNNSLASLIIFGSNVAGTTFTWENDNSTIGLATSGTGNIPAFVAKNPGAKPVIANVRVTPVANTCKGAIGAFTITVNPAPKLTSSLLPPAVCSNNTFSYTPASSTASTTFEWSRAVVAGVSNPAAIGNGNPNEVLINTTDNPITVTYVYSLTAFNCPASEIYEVKVVVNPLPKLSSSSTPAAICSGTLFSYSPTSNTAGATFAWSRPAVTGISNPAATGTNNPEETLINTTNAPIPVVYNYTITANGCVNESKVTVIVNPLPVTDFNINNPSQCLTGNSFAFTSTGGTGTFAWDLGDGTTATTSSVTHSYLAEGSYDVQLQVTGSNGCVKASDVKIVTVNPNPVAAFTYSTVNPVISDEYNFTNISTISSGTLTYNWDFGDGSTSTTKNPTHQYVAAGTYTVTLTVTSDIAPTHCTAVATASIVVTKNPNIVPGFTINPGAGGNCLNTNNFTFDASPTTSVNPIVSYDWEFGDGQTGTGKVVTHHYTNPGIYIVKLTVTDNVSNSAAVTSTVAVFMNPVLTKPADQTICNGSSTKNVNFVATPSSTVNSWTNNHPEIGLAASGTGNIPAFTAANTTNTPIVATITVSPVYEGCTGTSQTFTITVNPTPSVNSISDYVLCNGETVPSVTFSSNVTGATFAWVNDNTRMGLAGMGTGNISSFQGINSGAVPEVANIKVTAAANGCSSAAQGFKITVKPTPSLTSTLLPADICGGNVFNYTPQSTVAGTTFNWTRAAITGISNPTASGTGDPAETLVNTTNAPIAVTYNYTLSANGCNSSTTYHVVVVVNPIPVLTSSLTPPAICSGQEFNYSPETNVDGVVFGWTRAAIAGISNPPASGDYNPREVLNNTTNAPIPVVYTYTITANGCSSVQNVTVVVNPLPAANFNINDPSQCLNGNNFIFTNTSSAGTYNWNLGDGTVATTTNVTHTYRTDGTFNVKLTVQSATGCVDTSITKQVTVTPSPVAIITYSIIAPNSNDQYQFLSSRTRLRRGTTLDYLWNFGDGGTSTDPNPRHTYTASGTYTVKLIVTADNGCTDTASAIIKVTKNPNVVAGFKIDTTALCLVGNQFKFTNTTTVSGGASVTGYTWNFGDGTTSTLENPTHTYSAPGIYTVQLSVQTNTGFIAIASSSVEVFDMPVITPPANVTACAGSTISNINFSVKKTSAIVSWTNDHPEIGLAANGTGNIAGFTAINTTNAPIVATITTTAVSNDCASAPQQFTITVNPVPVLNGVSDQILCANNQTMLVEFISAVTGTVGNWTNDNTSIGLAAAGTGNIAAFTAINNSIDPVTATVTVTPVANGCSGTAIQYSYTINPAPRLTSTLTPNAVCSKAPFKYVPASNTANATFKWSRAAVPGISNPAASGEDSISEILINTTNTPITVKYLITVDAPGCGTATATVSVVVNPIPSLTSSVSPPDICNNTVFSYEPTSSVVGTQFSWTRKASSGLSNPAATGSGSPDETLNNITNDITRAIYMYTLDAGGCFNTQNVVVVIAPTILLTSSIQTKAICSGTTFFYQPVTNVQGAVITWSRAAIAGINEAATSGNGAINEVLTNTTAAPITVTYVYTLTFNGCEAKQNITVVVNPAPLLSSELADQTLCGGETTTAVPLRSDVAGTVFTWTNTNENIGLPANGTGDIPAFKTSTAFNSTIAGTIVVNGVTPQGCRLTTPAKFTITVNPTPTGNIILPKGVNFCQGNTVPLIATGGDRYQWYRNGTQISGATKAIYLAGESGTYSVSVFTNLGCFVEKAGNVVLTAAIKPVANFTFDRYCVNLPVTFTNTSVVNESGNVSYRWADNAGHASNDTSIIFTYTQAGTYNMQLIVTPLGCPSLVDSVTKAINIEAPQPGITLPLINTVPNSPTQLEARNIGNSTYLWEPATGLNNNTIRTPIAILGNDQQYLINMTMASGCVTTDTLLVRIKGDDIIYIPNVISPNGDGKNDRFEIIGLEKYPGSGMYIYNRWGNQVYQSKNYDNSWTGDGLNEGTYFYIFNLRLDTGEIKKYKGWILLVR
ncbi:PKD domain-containing protein [Chitinophaga silvatica]|uniref:PKD domain-containing protein n=1 Tax=Chitinophaga silvatica TaxID=2282649 RepID=A0A3E1YDV9_9BACT|nr:PKD domain-containing protein [Chitinophaga silvatica]RFS24698.1 PKD domain-containing protein [Chitinophaga silvatica]